MNLIERLIVNGEPMTISGYTIAAPRDGMGLSVTFNLARPDINSIPLDAEVTFEIGAKVWDGINEVWQESYAPPLIENGKLAGRAYSVRWIPDERGGYPGDVIEFTAFSVIADRWSIVPELPVILYNPALVAEGSFNFNDQDMIREYGNFVGGFRHLRPELEPVHDLNLHSLLNRCYRDGCGFDAVVTNLPNPTIDQVTIGYEEGYHGAALPFMRKVSLKLVIFEHNNVLHIYDPTRGLPEVFPAKTLPLDCVIEVNQSVSPEVLRNAVILSYKQDPNGVVYAGERPEEKIIYEPEVVSGDGDGETRQETYRRVTEYYDINTNELRRTLEHETVTSVYGYKDDIAVTVVEFTNSNVWSIYGDGGEVRANGEIVTNGTPTQGESMEVTVDGVSIGTIERGATGVYRRRVPGGTVLLSEDVLLNRYTGNTKAGHTRTLRGWYTNPGTRGKPEYGDLLEEVNTSTWTVDLNHPGSSILKNSVTVISGLCLKEFLPDGYVAYTPIQDADEGNLIKSDLSQTTEWRKIETHIEELRQTGVNQANVEPRVIDHLNGRPRRTLFQGRPGSRSTYFPNFKLPPSMGGHIRELIKDEASVAAHGLRQPLSLDVGNLDAREARELARRMIAYAKEPPKSFSISLPGYSFDIRRGSVVIPPLRSGYDNKAVVEAWQINASGIGTPQVSRNMRLDCTELKLNA